MDNIWLTSPQGSVYNLGSWLDSTRAIDFGTRDLIKQEYIQNSLMDGARLVNESAGRRSMSFPIIAASGGAGLALEKMIVALSLAARPGGYIDIYPEGTPSGEAIRFDLVGGEVAHSDYSVHLQRAARRRLDVKLETQPYGYWPTWMILVSRPAASLMLPDNIGGAFSIKGDAPAPARIIIGASVATQFTDANNVFAVDMVAWAFTTPSSGLTPGFPGYIEAIDLTGASTWSDPFAPGPYPAVQSSVTKALVAASVSASGWTPVFKCEPARITREGPARIFLWAKLAGSMNDGFQIAARPVGYFSTKVPWAPNGAVATLMPGVSSSMVLGMGLWGPKGSPGYNLLDLGEVTMPPLAPSAPIASGAEGGLYIYVRGPSAGLPIATSLLTMAGYVSLPMTKDGSGILTSGLIQPTAWAPETETTVNNNDPQRLVLSGEGDGYAFTELKTSSSYPSQFRPYSDARPRYIGDLPRLGATVTGFGIVVGLRRLGGRDGAFATARASSYGMVHAGQVFGEVIVVYRPTFRFLKGF